MIALYFTLESEGNPNVICFVDFYKRGDRHYRNILDNTEEYEKKFKEIIENNHSFILQLYKEWKKSFETQSTMPVLPEPYHELMTVSPLAIENNDVIICESKQWVDSLQIEEVWDNWSYFHKIIYRLVERDVNGLNCLLQYENQERFIYEVYDNRNNTILCERIIASHENDYNLQIWFLHDCDRQRLSADRVRSVLNGHSLEASDIPTLHSEIREGRGELEFFMSKAWRSYPAYILYDPDLWKKIHKEKCREANLPLSGEEEIVLSNSIPPIFLNGQAGSGKSTMLYYMFAHYYLEIKKINGIEPPIFVTYSKNLKNKAHDIVKSLLTSNAMYANKNKTKCKPEIEIDKNFIEFKELVKNLVNEWEFPEDKFVSFGKFKQMYRRRNYGTGISPEIVWHVIRTYVKGYNSENNLTPDNYDILPDKDKTIDKELYREIFESDLGMV